MKKIFEVKAIAEEFAKKVNGTISQSHLPGYNYIETIYVVEWKE